MRLWRASSSLKTERMTTKMYRAQGQAQVDVFDDIECPNGEQL
jgi:hypothetical protein